MRLLPRRKPATPDAQRVPLRLRRRGMSPLRAGVLVVALLVFAIYGAFTKHNPLHHGFQLKAVFSSALNVAKNTPVRIAGVPVGTVQSISLYRGTDVSVVTMSLNNDALPLHRDATLKIRPRIFLEGDFFVDLSPGSPSAPILNSGATIPITQTADPVQLDQVLSALNSDTRANLQDLLVGYGTALTHVPTPAQNVTQDPIVRGKTAAQALNDAARRSPASLRSSTIVSQAFGGEEPHDVSLLVASLGRVNAALGQNENDLQGLITNFDITLHAFATQSAALNSAVAQLPGALTTADQALAALNASFPATRAFALDLIPATEETPATVAAALPWIAQSRALVSPAELGELAQNLETVAPVLGALTPAQTTFAQALDPVSRCLAQVIFPAGNVALQDGAFSTGLPNYQEFFHAVVGLNGSGANFDGNGSYLRALVGGGGVNFDTGPLHIYGASNQGTPGGYDYLQGRATLPPLGVSPAAPANEPPIEPNAACDKQKLPDFNGPSSRGPSEATIPARPLPTL
jgi:virulence factor Mce-like protein